MKTNPESPINPTTVTIVVDPDLPRFNRTIKYSGLTKREYFASKVTVQNDELIDYAEIITRGLIPGGRTEETIKQWFEIEAKLKVMKADALIKALNKDEQQ